jgi:glycine/D-amino acid oxidase-like deaminating enzyme
MNIRSYDVIIIGAGIMGAALSLELARSKRRVLVIDSVGVCTGSSSRSSGGVRHQFAHPLNIEFAKRTIERIEHFEEEFGVDCGFNQVGYMFLVSNETTRRNFMSAIERQRALGIPTSFISADDVARLVPGIRVDDLLGASFCPTDGFLDPYSVTSAFVKAARELGATIKSNAHVTSFVVVGDRVSEVKAASGESFGADVVVNATGAWAPHIARLYGADLPITPWTAQAFTLHDTPDFGQQLPFVIDFDHDKTYFHREGPGLLVGTASHGGPAPEPTWEPICDWSEVADIAAGLTSRVPALADARAVGGWAGFLELTPDEDPIVGWTHLANVYTAAGFSGHGICIAPGLAGEVAREVQGLMPTLDLSGYRLERFGAGSPEPDSVSMR